MSRPYILAAGLVGLLSAAPVVAGEMFDAGGGHPVTIYANGDVQSSETYAPFPFGQWPLGTIVFADMKPVAFDQLGRTSGMFGEPQLVRGFECYFTGVSCQCGGALAVPTLMRFAYDPLVVETAGMPEEGLKLLFRDDEQHDWILMPGAMVDTENNVITAIWSRPVLGYRQFAILTNDITPVAVTSWGRIKDLYRR